MRYEYRVRHCNRAIVNPETLDREFGDDGWLLVQIVPDADGYIFYFARASAGPSRDD